MTETRGTREIPDDPATCVFCSPAESRIAWTSSLAIAIWDGFPVSPGHALIVPRRHIAAWDDLTGSEKDTILTGIDSVRALIADRHRPDAYNVGFNDGLAAGQTVMHFHVHVIPRYSGDMPDPRGGVRWAVREKAAYWLDSSE